MAIDAKIEELTTQINRKIEGLAMKFEAAMRGAAANQERANQALEARCLASSSEAAGHLENRLAVSKVKQAPTRLSYARFLPMVS